jgi:NAD(P)-dependent dehydrogenase (short-subunit alcohol dehydrogenase family)
MKVSDAMDLTSRVAFITGAGGLLGARHAEAIAEMGGIPVLADIDCAATQRVAHGLESRGAKPLAIACDITDPASVGDAVRSVLKELGRIDILINNAARNPKVEGGGASFDRLETFPLAEWDQDLAVGLTGAFLCSQAIGPEMARRGKGVILNIASDLAVIAPDQRLYRQEGRKEREQPVKPVSYPVVKSALLGLTRYLATYWADKGVRCNALSPGGVFAGQDATFLARLQPLIPLGRMAQPDEYKAAVVFLVSDASSYMTGQNLVMDGGRSAW